MKTWRYGAVVGVAAAVVLAAAGRPPAAAQESSGPPLVSQEQFDRWLVELSNWGRWGRTTSWARST